MVQVVAAEGEVATPEEEPPLLSRLGDVRLVEAATVVLCQADLERCSLIVQCCRARLDGRQGQEQDE